MTWLATLNFWSLRRESMNITYQESLSLFACACTQTFYSSLLRLVLIFCSLLCVTHDFHWNHFLLPEIHPLEFSFLSMPFFSPNLRDIVSAYRILGRQIFSLKIFYCLLAIRCQSFEGCFCLLLYFSSLIFCDFNQMCLGLHFFLPFWYVVFMFYSFWCI